jgi:hypothetical protein
MVEGSMVEGSMAEGLMVEGLMALSSSVASLLSVASISMGILERVFFVIT